eukprot:GHVH01000513.1.p1 GENE.GHVH01000513.1~~GHVH01000513.1.p1  ORF type:complete len:510 (-),score=76.48 GHVH01000513.1:1140-2669(-)
MKSNRSIFRWGVKSESKNRSIEDEVSSPSSGSKIRFKYKDFKNWRRRRQANPKEHDDAIQAIRATHDAEHCLSIDNASQPDENLLCELETTDPSLLYAPVRRASVGVLASAGDESSVQHDTERIRAFFHERPLSIDDFQKRKLIGCGSYGTVHLMVYGKTKKVTMKDGTLLRLPPFAVKSIAKQPLVDLKKDSHALSEKELLIRCSHPNLVTLYAAIQDDVYLYMIQEFICGGELMTRIHSNSFPGSRLPLDHCRFYFAESYAAIYALHQKNICYRDIKPENVVITYDGHLKFVDFGFAKFLEEKSGSSGILSRLMSSKKVDNKSCTRTYTLVGTPEYLAPEFLVQLPNRVEAPVGGKPHGFEVDLWGLGILIYEMLVGHTPYYSETNDIADTYHNILNSRVPFAENFDPQAKDLIKRLLVKKPSERLGCGHTAEVYQHSFLKGHYSTRDLLNGLLEPPWIPELKNELDTSYFIAEPEMNQSKSTRQPGADEQQLFSQFDSSWNSFRAT